MEVIQFHEKRKLKLIKDTLISKYAVQHRSVITDAIYNIMVFTFLIYGLKELLEHGMSNNIHIFKYNLKFLMH